MQKIVLILVGFFVLSIGLQVNLLKSIGLNPSFSLFTFCLVVLLSLDKYRKNDYADLLIYALIGWVGIKYMMLGNSFAIDSLKACILCLIFKKYLLTVKVTNFQNMDYIVYISGVLGLIGYTQFFSVPYTLNIQPLANSDFVGSGGFANISVIRPNFALGNSLNTGLFFVLNIYLTILMSQMVEKKIYPLFILLFIGCIMLTLSRTALIQLIVLTPLLIGVLGYRTILLGGTLIYVTVHEYIYLIYLRLLGGDFTQGSYLERLELVQNFMHSLSFESIIFGTLSVGYQKITDGLLLHIVQNLGVIFALAYLIGMFRINKLLSRLNITFILLILISILLTNGFYAYYNLFLLLIILRMLDIRSEIIK